MSEAQACATCYYWEEQSKRCRRYAPHAIPASGDGGEERRSTLWALTEAEDWCGDYESNVEDDVEAEEEYEEDEQWEADGTLKVTVAPPSQPVRRGLFG